MVTRNHRYQVPKGYSREQIKRDTDRRIDEDLYRVKRRLTEPQDVIVRRPLVPAEEPRVAPPRPPPEAASEAPPAAAPERIPWWQMLWRRLLGRPDH